MKLSSYNPFVGDLARCGLEYAVRHAAELGFDAVEWLERCPASSSAVYKKYAPDLVCDTLEKYGLSVSCFSSFADILHPDRTNFDADIRAQIDFASAIGSPAFHHTVIPWLKLPENAPTYEEIFDRVLEYETALSNYCREKGLLSLYEPQGMYFNGTWGLSRLILSLRERGCDNVGLCADVGNSYYIDESPLPIFKALGAYTGQIHLKDMVISETPLDHNGKRHQSRGGKYLYDTELGMGNVEIAESLRVLLAGGYDGAISFEIDGDDDLIRRSLSYVKKIIG